MSLTVRSVGWTIRRLRHSLLIAAFTTLSGLLPAGAEEGAVSIELNRLESKGEACRVYLVINNESPTEYKNFKLDLVLFRPDGIVDRNFKIDLAPLRANKRIVKLCDLNIDGNACDQIGSFLINDVVECTTLAGPVDNCLSKITTSSTLTNVQLTK